MSRTARAQRAIALLGVAAALLLGGCSYKTTPTDPGTVNFLIEAMPTNLDPRVGVD